MKTSDLVGYTFNAANYCAEHVTAAMGAEPASTATVEMQLEIIAAKSGMDREDERGFDSGDFPKVIHRDSANVANGEDDPGDQCDTCGTELVDELAIPWREAADFRDYLREFLRGYMECAVWASNNPDTELPLDKDYSTENISPELKAKMRSECAAFILANRDDLDKLSELTGRATDYNGHDLWLTRNGHGTGYWDRYSDAPREDRDAAEQVGKRLSDAARQLGAFDLTPEDGELVSMM